MAKQDLIVHRGNSPFNMPIPAEQAGYYAEAGFRRIEIDVYSLSATTYKFCHPLDKDRVDEIYDVEDGYLETFIAKYPGIEWLVDLKCLDLAEVPLTIVDYLVKCFGASALFVAAQPEVLELIHRHGMRTAQYFREAISSELSFEPEFYMQNADAHLRYSLRKTIVSCPTLNQGLEYLDKDFGGVMVDGNLLIQGQ